MKTLYFVRHGQTDWNKVLRWQGSSDNSLNQLGLAQADAVARYFVEQAVPATAVISSPLKRAMTTARTITNSLGIELLLEPDFTELDLGDFEGKTTDELKAEYGKQFEVWLSRYHVDATPGGESLAQGRVRVSAPLKRYMRLYNAPIIIVAHQAIICAMKASLSGKMDLPTLASYKQANYEIDAWDVDSAVLGERIDIR